MFFNLSGIFCEDFRIMVPVGFSNSSFLLIFLVLVILIDVDLTIQKFVFLIISLCHSSSVHISQK